MSSRGTKIKPGPLPSEIRTLIELGNPRKNPYRKSKYAPRTIASKKRNYLNLISINIGPISVPTVFSPRDSQRFAILCAELAPENSSRVQRTENIALQTIFPGTTSPPQAYARLYIAASVVCQRESEVQVIHNLDLIYVNFLGGRSARSHSSSTPEPKRRLGAAEFRRPRAMAELGKHGNDVVLPAPRE
jgi:hypothetical protein